MFFRGEYAFLSNFYICEITLPTEDGPLNFTSVEAAFQGIKCLDPKVRKQFEILSPNQAKLKGRRVPLRIDWSKNKVQLMRQILRIKFRDRGLARLLMAVPDEVIVEDNTWKDKFWGKYHGIGQNVLGKLLTEVREELRAAEEQFQGNIDGTEYSDEDLKREKLEYQKSHN